MIVMQFLTWCGYCLADCGLFLWTSSNSLFLRAIWRYWTAESTFPHLHTHLHFFFPMLRLLIWYANSTPTNSTTREHCCYPGRSPLWKPLVPHPVAASYASLPGFSNAWGNHVFRATPSNESVCWWPQNTYFLAWLPPDLITSDVVVILSFRSKRLYRAKGSVGVSRLLISRPAQQIPNRCSIRIMPSIDKAGRLTCPDYTLLKYVVLDGYPTTQQKCLPEEKLPLWPI